MMGMELPSGPRQLIVGMGSPVDSHVGEFEVLKNVFSRTVMFCGGTVTCGGTVSVCVCVCVWKVQVNIINIVRSGYHCFSWQPIVLHKLWQSLVENRSPQFSEFLADKTD